MSHLTHVPQRPARLRSHVLGAVLGLLVSASLPVSGQAPEPAGLQAADTPGSIAKSPNDTREYRYFELPNGLRVIVVSEADAEVAAASMDVHVGSGDEPFDRPGLAHFLEHMLFLGTDRYPNAGEYQQFISSRGGSHNAYTSYDRTNFHFSLEAGALDDALQRFSRFFIAPVMDARYVDRERQAVHAEYSSSQKNDSRRTMEAFKRALNPAHPMSRFFVGSLTTLADRDDAGVRADLRRFYESHYRAGNMTLSVLGRVSLDALEATIRELFAEVPGGSGPDPAPRPPLFAPAALPARLSVVPEREYRSLSLTFPIPATTVRYRAKPTYYISHLLGHEGPGSLVSLLRRRGLANGLNAGPGLVADDAATFTVSVSLTEAGMSAVDDVAASVFDAIELIRRAGPERRRFDELARVADLDFRFMEPSSAAHLTRALANNMHDYPVRDVLRGPYRFDDFDPDLIKLYLDALVPERTLLTLSGPNVETDRRTPYFDTPYRLQRIGAAELAKFRAHAIETELRLPPPNPFLPERVTLLAGAGDEAPRAVVDEPGLTVWHQQDTSFGVPLASFYVSLRSAAANATPRATIMTRLLVGMLNEQLRETAYPAAVAGLGVRLYPHLRGLSFRIDGYSDRQAVLARAVIAALRAPELTAGRFARVHARIRRRLENRRLASPNNQAMAAVTELLLDPQWSNSALLDALAGVDLAALAAFAPTLTARLDLEVLSHGNVARDDARKLTEVLRTGLLSEAEVREVPPARVVRLERGELLYRNVTVDHADQALAIYVQGTESTRAQRAAVGLLAQIISSAFYTELRTNQQLGYVVFASSMPIIDVPGLLFVIQSPTHPTAVLRERIDAFLVQFEDTLAALDGATFERYRSSMHARLLERDKTLSERSSRYWGEIDRHPGRFDERQRLASALLALGRDDILEVYDRLVRSPDRAVLAVHAAAESDSGRRLGAQILDGVAFRRNRPRF